MNRIIMLGSVILIFFGLDYYIFQAVKTLIAGKPLAVRRSVVFIYWGLSGLALLSFVAANTLDKDMLGSARYWLFTFVFMHYLSKFVGILPLFFEDIVRLLKKVISLFDASTPEALPGKKMSRSEFISKTSLALVGAPMATMSFGIISGAHDYRVRRETLYLPNLPKAFDGLRFAQLSDIHSGSFFNKTAVQGGIDMLLAEKPDLVFFTGDLVNNKAEEMKNYKDVFARVKAPLGVFSITGNHDYGDYVQWESEKAKRRNFEDLKRVHKEMGWNLLLNEHRSIEVDNEKIGLLGIENWGTGRFAQYGDLSKAYAGTDEFPVKILLSHDPSHWDAQVRESFKDIDLMLAGHTHGMQFGVEIGGFQWSPVKYRYKQWGGLYREDNQYLYVNRGYGYIGYPGRVGMPPEITIIELKSGVKS